MDVNKQVIDEFRVGNGQVGGYFEGARLLLLTTTGARSGKPHTTPLAYLPDGASACWSSPPPGERRTTRPGITI